jgi:hypothetical protein
VSSKQIAKAVSTASAIAKDIAGNLSAGQDARAVAHLRNLMAVLDGIEDKLDVGNDFKAEKKLDAVLQDAYDRLDEMPAFDPLLMDAAHAKWQTLGIDFTNILQSLGDVSNPDSASTPEGKEALQEIQKQLREQGVNV